MIDETKVKKDEIKRKYITFSLDKDVYCINIDNVIEIIGLHKITNIPKVPRFIKGVINLRGEILPIIDTRIKFGKTEIEYDETSSTIVVEVNENLVGLMVDRVEEVLEIADNNIIAPPEYKQGIETQYIKGITRIDNQKKYIVDYERLITEEMMA